MHFIAKGFLLLACLASVWGRSNVIANKYFLEKQKFLLEVLLRLEDPFLKQEWVRTGSDMVLDKAEYADFNEHMIDFYRQYKSGFLLPRGAHFSALLPRHAHQAWGLYNILYNSRDWETLVNNICWARQHVNEGVFLHTLTQLLFKRGDLKGLILPKISEALPHHFFSSNFVHAAESFDFANWSRAKQLFGAQYKSARKSRSCDHCWPWQWWRFKRLEKAVYEDADKHLLPMNLSGLRNSTQWWRAMQNVKLLWMPADYSREMRPKDKESKLSYFIEDVGWNSYWYYLNMGLSWSGETSYKPTLRSFWFWNVHQLLARYKIERLSRGLGGIESISYEPHLMSWTGAKFKALEVEVDPVQLSLDKILQRTHEALNEDSYTLSNGQNIAFDSVAHLNLIMDDIFDKLFEDFTKHLGKMSQPTLLHNFETMLREPVFYRYADKLLEIYWLLRSTMLSYSTQELTLPGVKLEQVHVSALVSYFELVDADVSNLLSNKMFYYEGQLMREKALMARQQRLTHKPFRLLFNITAERPQNVILRTFLGPRAQQPALLDWRNFYQLDTFVTMIPAGNNLIQRRSVDFFGTIKDHPSHTELYRLEQLALDGEYDFSLNITTTDCGYPQRLLLPQGWSSGLPLQMFFIATPYNYIANEAHNLDCDFSNGIESFDDLPYGFPFDRPLELADLLVPNAYMTTVKIFHEDKRLKRFK